MNKPLGVGFIGTGHIATQVHLPVFRKLADEGLVNIVAVCDIDPDKARSVAEKFSVPQYFTDYSDLVARDDIDVVSVCTPNFLHLDPVIKSFAAGKHVLCEKPLAINATEGEAMVAAAEKAQRQLMVGLNWRYDNAAQAAHRFVRDGMAGEIYYARAHAIRRRGIPGWGMFTQKDKQGGGPLIDMGVHVLDLTMWLMGNPVPVSVTGATYTKFGTREGIIGLRGQWDRAKYTVEDLGVGLIRFANGASLSLEASFALNIERDRFETSLMGTEGGIHLDPLKYENTRLFREESGTLTDTTLASITRGNSHEAEIRDFVDALINGREVAIPGSQALALTRILDALYLSAETGREVRLDQ